MYKDPNLELRQALREENPKGMVAALERGADPNRAIDGFPMLIRAAAAGQEALVEALIKAGASIDERGVDGRTALMHVGQLASRPVDFRVLDLLLAERADLNAAAWNEIEEENETTLDMAVRFRNAESVRFLLARGAKASHRSRLEAKGLIADLEQGKPLW